MSKTTCPACGRVGNTNHPIPPKAKVRCSGCQEVFIYDDPDLQNDSDFEDEAVTLKPAKVHPNSTATPTRRTKDCLYCGEEILSTAKKCKHCGEFLDASLRVQKSVASSSPSRPSVQQFVVHTQSAPSWSPGIAALLSFFVPGAGQIYKGEVLGGLTWMFCTVLGYVCFIVPGLVLHLICVVLASSGDPRLQSAGIGTNLPPDLNHANQFDPAREAVNEAAQQKFIEIQQRKQEQRETAARLDRERRDEEKRYARQVREEFYRDRGVEPGPMAWFKVLPDWVQPIILGVAVAIPAGVIAVVWLTRN